MAALGLLALGCGLGDLSLQGRDGGSQLLVVGLKPGARLLRLRHRLLRCALLGLQLLVLREQLSDTSTCEVEKLLLCLLLSVAALRFAHHLCRRSRGCRGRRRCHLLRLET